MRWSAAWAAICLIGISASGYASSVTIESATAIPGFGTCNIPVTLGIDPGEQVAGAQWDLVFDSDVITVKSIETGSVAAAAGKSVSFSTIEAGRIRVLVTGLNMNVMSSGVMAIVTISVPAGSPGGDQPLDMEDAVLADPYGVAVPCVAGSGTLTVDDAALSAGLDTGLRQCLACCILLTLGMLYLRRQGKMRWLHRL